ncbi:MAG: 4-amino-4-deoxy-L-arabinose transferase-like glycosyltransferase [Cellvibrionaceae bacterium]|jgi:4-amino-4-deoxy-L-arabinose transferase-like glycosyltransferase
MNCFCFGFCYTAPDLTTVTDNEQRRIISRNQDTQRQNRSQKGWVFLLLACICITAAGLRFWQLGDLPPGLYRDEAFNGVDALGILSGEHALFFEANNGREPGYIYLSSIAVALLGNTPLAIRLMAAVVGTLTTLVVYALAKSWYGQLVGLFAAWLWAVTLLPIHLSRIGLRIILAIPVVALALWLGTLAYRHIDPKKGRWLWLAAGACTGLGFYTYLTARLFPMVLILIVGYLLLAKRPVPWRGLGWALVGWLVIMLPLFNLWLGRPELLSGRTGQVSILNPLINQGDLLGTFIQNSFGALGLFFIEGDTIVRHNLPGRPLFDILMALPFCIGLVWMVRNWAKPAVVATVCWVAVMLSATVLAEDAPHFLRASGILPAALFPAAIGLAWGWQLPRYKVVGRIAVVVILSGSLWLTVQDYFVKYPSLPETSYLFESAARDLAEQINAESTGVPVFVDRRYQDNWPSIAYLVEPDRELFRLNHRDLIANWFTGSFALYVWPIDGVFIDGMYAGVAKQNDRPILVSTQTGPMTRGDLETEIYPLYLRFSVADIAGFGELTALVGSRAGSLNGSKEQGLYQLHAAESNFENGDLIVDLFWSQSSTTLPADMEKRHDIVFVHVIDKQSLQVIAQSDSVPGQGYWAVARWQPNMLLHDQHVIRFNQPWDPDRYQLLVGMYPAADPKNRLIITLPNGQTGGNTVEIR